jgi:hypothetical protein
MELVVTNKAAIAGWGRQSGETSSVGAWKEEKSRSGDGTGGVADGDDMGAGFFDNHLLFVGHWGFWVCFGCGFEFVTGRGRERETREGF